MTIPEQPPPTPSGLVTSADKGKSVQRYASVNSDGNHLSLGSSALDELSPIDITLDFQPVWLLGIETQLGSGWVALSEEGVVAAFEAIRREIRPLTMENLSLPAGMPPTVISDGETIQLLKTDDPLASSFASPVYLPRTDRVAYLDLGGTLILLGDDSKEELQLEALPDAKILVDSDERILLIGSRTDRYEHGVLGDGYEGASIFLVQTDPKLEILSEIQLPEREVVEGISPIWQDLNIDGEHEILVTISDRDEGAYLAIYSEDGMLLARSETIGRAFRWRHQITAADFSGTEDVEIAAVLTPHIGGVLQYFHWEGNRLILEAEVGGVSSHMIGSRNLDMALSIDFDNDQQLEILLPNTTYDVLGAYQREGATVQLEWQFPFDAKLSTNLAGISYEDGRVGFGVGLENGHILLWLPQ